MPRTANATRPSDVFRTRLVDVRKALGFSSQARLAQRLTDLGYSMHETTLTRIERGTRKVTLDDAVAIAAALDVPLTALLLPGAREELVQLTPKITVSAATTSDWLLGLSPLDDAHARSYSLHVTPWERGLERNLSQLVAEAERMQRELGTALVRARELDEAKEASDAS